MIHIITFQTVLSPYFVRYFDFDFTFSTLRFVPLSSCIPCLITTVVRQPDAGRGEQGRRRNIYFFLPLEPVLGNVVALLGRSLLILGEFCDIYKYT